MNKTWITRTAIAAAGVAIFALASGTAQAAPGQGGCLRPLIEAGTITQEQAYELHEATDALKTAGVENRQAHRQALADLVANGTLTQSQADAIVAARPPRGTRPAGARPADTQARTAPSGSASSSASTGSSAASGAYSQS